MKFKNLEIKVFSTFLVFLYIFILFLAHLTEDCGEVYLYRNFDEYDRLSFLVKPKDKNLVLTHLMFKCNCFTAQN